MMKWIHLLINLLFIMSLEGQEQNFMREREEMIRRQLIGRDISDPNVLAAMLRVERHRFVLPEYLDQAYTDQPLPIGSDQTISQPYIVAYMIEAAGVEPGERVLEIGTGCGYQAAVLAEIASEVYTMEIIEGLAHYAIRVLRDLDYDNVHVRIGDGYQGWVEHAPYDAIIVAAAAPQIPQPLIDQLAEGGRLIIPVGEEGEVQYLVLLRKHNGRLHQKKLAPVRFVPFTRA